MEKKQLKKDQGDANQWIEHGTKKSGIKIRSIHMAQMAVIALAIWLLSSATAGALQLGPELVGSGPSQPVQERASVNSSQQFKDLPVSHWAWSPIQTMCDSGIVKGYPDQSFKPEQPVSYGEYIKMATVILDGKDVGNGVGENWAAEYYKKGLENSFYTDYDIPEVKLNWDITRGDMALIISGLLGNEVVENYDQVAGIITDVDSKTKHEYEIVKAYGMAILEGYPDGSFRPEETLNRAEAAASLYRIIEKKSVKSIASVAGNMGEYWKEDWIESWKEDWEEGWEEGWAESEVDSGNYKIVLPEDVGLKIRIPWNGRVAGFDHTMVGFIYLIKDGQIVEYCRSIPAETFITSGAHYELETIDYIMCIPSKNGNQETILLVENPFRRQV